jgi:hypothetical protein
MLPQGVFLTEIEAAEFFQKRGISLKAKTLAKLRSTGGGPPFVYVGRWPRYTEALLAKWITERVSEPQSIVPEKLRQTRSPGDRRRGRPRRVIEPVSAE